MYSKIIKTPFSGSFFSQKMHRKLIIITETFKDNFEFMIALNGWKSTERSIKEVVWRLKMFQGQIWNYDEWDIQ